jgi:hypothetical protein
VDSGLASVVTSTSSARPNHSPIARRIRVSGSAPTSDGVPPPTNTVETRRPVPRILAARSISASAASSQDCGEAALPSSPAV